LKGRLDGKDIKTMAVRLSTTKKVLQIFPEQPPEDRHHIYVQKSAGESLALNVVLHTGRTDKVTSYPYSPHCGLITPLSFLHMNCAEISCLLLAPLQTHLFSVISISLSYNICIQVSADNIVSRSLSSLLTIVLESPSHDRLKWI
jgi:hypothetical protein